jgi:hypothetical protein
MGNLSHVMAKRAGRPAGVFCPSLEPQRRWLLGFRVPIQWSESTLSPRVWVRGVGGPRWAAIERGGLSAELKNVSAGSAAV